MTDALRLHGRVDYLSLNYQDYDGQLTNWVAALEWRFARHWGVGAGYRYVDYKLEETTSQFNGRVQYKFSGPTLLVNAAF